MEDQLYDFGMIGLGTMGRNFILNVTDHGFSAVGLDRDEDKARTLEAEAGDRNIKGTTSMEEFVSLLKKPRVIMLLVPAGKVVDSVINDLLDHVEKNDLIIDGGNSHFPDTDRRAGFLSDRDLHYLGVGVSGGAKGARRGPSIMPGGNRDAYGIVKPIFEAAAAKVNGEPCVAYLGTGSAGHYVKMVHNGIEYGLMQLIAEAYDLLHQVAELNNEAIHQTFDRWNQGPLNSFLIEITAGIFTQQDSEGSGMLIDKILDKAKQKGTGRWTSQNAMDLGIPIPTIDAAVSMRGLSARKQERIGASQVIKPTLSGLDEGTSMEALVPKIERALHFAFIVTYAQGLDLLAEASHEYNFDLDLAQIAKIWRGGCIIRAALLENIRQAYADEPSLDNLIVSPVFTPILMNNYNAIRQVIKTGADFGIPLLALSSALNYFDACRSARLPLNLVQAQRDYFGSHTYERTDKEGTFHTEWED